MNEQVKPQVIFGLFDGFLDRGEGKRLALVRDCEGHPRLGYQSSIRTSLVLNVDNEERPNVIETLNTFYIRRGHEQENEAPTNHSPSV